MVYARWQVGGPLGDYVESFAIQESPRAESGSLEPPTKVLPTACADLVLEYGDPFVEVTASGEEVAPALALGGQRTRPASFRATGETGLFVINFHPWATRFFGPSAEITDSLVDLEAVLGGSRGSLLIERLREANGAAERVAFVEEFLLAHLPSEGPDPCVVAAVRCLQACCGRTTIAGLAKRLGMSRRHLVRVMQRDVGIAPKMLARILRFQAAMSRKRAGRCWSEIAETHGFTDHAHLTRECRRLAGVAPSAFEDLAGRAPLQSYFNPGGGGQSDYVLYL